MNNSAIWVGSIIATAMIAAPAGYMYSEMTSEDSIPTSITIEKAWNCSYIIPETFTVGDPYSSTDGIFSSRKSGLASDPEGKGLAATYKQDSEFYGFEYRDYDENGRGELCFFWQMKAKTNGTLYYSLWFRVFCKVGVTSLLDLYYDVPYEGNFTVWDTHIDANDRITLTAAIIGLNSTYGFYNFQIWTPKTNYYHKIASGDFDITKRVAQPDTPDWTYLLIAIDYMMFEPVVNPLIEPSYRT